MRKSWHNSLTDLLSLFRIFRIVSADSFEDKDLTPFVRLVDRGQDLVQVLAFVKFEIVLTSGVLNL